MIVGQPLATWSSLGGEDDGPAGDHGDGVLERGRAQVVVDEGGRDADHAQAQPVAAVVQPVFHGEAHNVTLHFTCKHSASVHCVGSHLLVATVSEVVSDLQRLVQALLERHGGVACLAAKRHHGLKQGRVESESDRELYGLPSLESLPQSLETSQQPCDSAFYILES